MMMDDFKVNVPSQDKIAGFAEAPFTLNQYTYCWNKTMNLVDLDGELPIIPPIPYPEWFSDAGDAVLDGLEWLGQSTLNGLEWFRTDNC